MPFDVKRLELFFNDEDAIVVEVHGDDFSICESNPRGWGYEEIDLTAARLLRDFLNYAVPDATDLMLATPIEELRLSLLTISKLKEENIHLIGDLTRHTEVELLKLPRIGSRILKEVKAALKDQNLRLAGKCPL